MLPFLNGPMLSGGGEDSSFMGILRSLGLTSGLKLCLDAGAIASFPGSSQKWLDMSGNGYDWFLGDDISSGEAEDPTFNGVVGALSSAEYFSTDGDDYFTYDSAQETWMQNLSKNGVQFTMLFWLHPEARSAEDAVLSTFNGAGFNGVSFYTSGSTVLNCPVFTVLDGGSHLSPNTISGCTHAFSLQQWHLIGISINENGGANAGFFYQDGQYNPSQVTGTETWNPDYSGAGTSNTSPPKLWRNSQTANSHMVANSRLAGVMIWEGEALTKAQIDKIWNRQRVRFGLHNGTWTGTPGGNTNAGASSGLPGIRFTANQSANVQSVVWNLAGSAGVSTLTASIYADDGGSPSSPTGAALYMSTNTQSASSTGEKSWNFSGAVLTEGTKYWIVVDGFSGGLDPTWSCVSSVPGFNSGRHATITSIDSTGQQPEAGSLDWKVKIIT